MEKAVQRLGCVLPHERMWSMAIVANRRLAMAPLHPPLELFTHDMAIGARGWIVRQVRSRS